MLAGTLGRAFFFVRRLKAAEVDGSELDLVASELNEKLKLRRPAKVLVTSCSVGPAVIGLFRPLIVLPKFIVDRRSTEELKPILAHELIHVRRGDLWIGLFRHVARSLWWFHPFVWKASSAIRRSAERCCDEEVVASLGITPNDYARALLDVLELKQVLKAVPVVPGVRPFDITSKRLERIMKLGQGSRQQTPRWCWAVAMLLAVISLPGAALIHGEENVGTDPGESKSQTTEPVDQPLVSVPEPIPAENAVEPLSITAAPAMASNAADADFPMTKHDEPSSIKEPFVILECLLLSAKSSAFEDLKVKWQTMPRSKTISQADKATTAALRSSNGKQWGESQ